MTKRYIGTSGWQYADWKGIIYPEEMPAKDQLAFYATKFNTVEINSTFYHMPRVTTAQKWYGQVSDEFRFTLKLNRYLTHTKRLIIDEESTRVLDEFITTARALKEKLGLVLIQLPPSLKCDTDRLRTFLEAVNGAVPLAFECRHESWFTDEVKDVLHEFQVAWVINDSPNRWPSAKFVIGRQLYIRFHGNKVLYKSSYTDEELRQWAGFIMNQHVETSWIYFNNDYGGVGPKNAEQLRAFCED